MRIFFLVLYLLKNAYFLQKDQLLKCVQNCSNVFIEMSSEQLQTLHSKKCKKKNKRTQSDWQIVIILQRTSFIADQRNANNCLKGSTNNYLT